MKKLVFGICTLLLSVSTLANEVNIYSYRQPYLIKPIVESFTKETGIKVNITFAKKGLAERLKREGEYTQADLVMTTDISRLKELVDMDLSQAVVNDTINANIPAQYRDPENHWFALTLRVRNIFVDKSLMAADAPIRYEDLADERFKGKVCLRSGKHPYNVALVSSMLAHHGKEKTKSWLEGVKANLARKPQGNDRGQVKAIKEGLCAVALGNSYYYGLMLKDENQKIWADAVNIRFPNQQDRGAHVNVSGMVMTKFAPNKANAEKLMAFLTGDKAQNQYAAVNMEYPVKPGVKKSPMVASWGQFNADQLAVAKIAANRTDALKLLDEVKFDL